MKTGPSIKEIPLSEKREKSIIDEVYTSFDKYSFGRGIINVKKLSQDELNSQEFRNLTFQMFGVNTLLDRVWLVDAVIKGAHYSYEGIGDDFGKSIGLGETENIIKSFLKRFDLTQNVREFKGQISQELVQKAIDSLQERGLAATSILTSFYESHNFWDMPLFKGSQRPSDTEGEVFGLPVYGSNAVPKGITIILNKNIGTLYIKSPLKVEILENFDKEKVLRDIPSLSPQELDEKVVFKALETIKFEVQNLNAVEILKNTSMFGTSG